MTNTLLNRRRGWTPVAALLLSLCAGTAAAQPPLVLDAADHAELAAGMSADGVVRVALLDDRIARVIRAPGDFAIEHDPAAGDLYLRPTAEHAPRESDAPPMPGAPHGPADLVPPASLFVGSEKGSTYRLTLTPVAGGPAQILIRGVEPEPEDAPPRPTESDRVADIAGLIRAVASGVPPSGYVVEPIDRDSAPQDDISPLEVWRGPGRDAVVIAMDADVPVDAPALAERLGPDVVAVWIGPAAGTPSRGGGRAAGGQATMRFAGSRLAVVVRGTGSR